MNRSLINLATLLKDPHLAVPCSIVIALEIAKIWLPEYMERLNATQKVIMFYMVAVAANSGGQTVTDMTTKLKDSTDKLEQSVKDNTKP